MNIVYNYQQDLIKSTKTPLLIELNKKDIDQFDTNGYARAILNAKFIYNQTLKSEDSTNLIYVDGDKYHIDNTKEDNQIILLEEIIKLTSKQIQSAKNINIVKAGVKGALSYFTGGLVKESIGGYVDSSIDQVSNLLNDSIEDVMDIVTDQLDIDITTKVLDQITDEVDNILNNITSHLFDEMIKQDLNISYEAKEKLDKLSSQFSKDLTPIGIFSLILQLILATAIKSNKIIFINNPHKLDKDSLAILSLLFSFAKDLKEKKLSDDEKKDEDKIILKHTGLSVVYCYSDEEFQPYQELKDEQYKISKKLLDEQRRFTQRYAMLERPSSDIPNIVLKSSTFVGREEELGILKEQFDKSQKDSKFKNIEIVKADPGIGKTKLVNKHIEQIRESESNGQRIIQLTILNQVGHSSSNTGLSSLKDSILNEARRLETLKTLEDTIIDKIKDLAVDKTLDTIESLLGINNIIEIGSSIHDSMSLEKNTIKMLEHSSEDINTKNQKSKEQQFEDIREAIIKLQSLCDETLPIILFIDDLQWIDEDSSEFILKYFTQTMKFNTYIVATQRASDATTALKLAQENSTLNPYKISLLQQAGITTDKTIDDPKDVTKLISNIIDLKGLDEKNLTELIYLTIDLENQSEDKKEKDTTLAKSIIKNLINENNEYVNTLFAIETINMLCDEKLYSSNKDIKQQLILQNPLRYNENIDKFEQILTDTFKTLNSKYNDAFEHANSDKEFGQQFNLMAYAVLEERLHILHEYFGEYGNAAVNTLLFSSLLGTPFNSEIVKNILEELSDTKEELLQPLKEYIKESKQCNLDDVHYEIIEEIYEILSRYIQFDSTYSYKHNLLEIFLEKQLEYILDRIFEKEKIIEAKDKLFEIIINEIEKEEKKQKFYNKDKLTLNTTEYESMLFYKKIEHYIYKKGFNNNKNKWGKIYAQSFSDLSLSFQNVKKFTQALEINEESLKNIEILYNENSKEYVKNIADSLFLASVNCSILNYYEKGIDYVCKLLDITEALYKKDPEQWLEVHISSLMILSRLTLNDDGKALDTIKMSLNIIKKYFDINQEKWAMLYTSNLIELASHYKKNKNIDKSYSFLYEAFTIRKKLYKKNQNKWKLEYIEILIKIYRILYDLNEVHEAIKNNKLVLELLTPLFKEKPYEFGSNVINTLIDLSNYLMAIKNNQDIDAIFEKANEITLWFKEINPAIWSELYYKVQKAYIVYLFYSNKPKEALELIEKLKKTYNKLFDLEPSRLYSEYKELFMMELLLKTISTDSREKDKLPVFDFLDQEFHKVLDQEAKLNPIGWKKSLEDNRGKKRKIKRRKKKKEEKND